MAKTLGQFAVGMANLATGLPHDMEAATGKAALKVTTAARASIARASGGDSRLSGMASKKTGKGGKVGARYDMAKAGTHGRSASALVRATGPLHILDSPTRRHQVMASVKKGRSSKSKAGRAQREAFYNAIFGGEGGFSGVKPLAFKGGGFAYRAQHPGTRGKRSFWTAVDRVAPSVPAIYQDALASSMVKRLK